MTKTAVRLATCVSLAAICTSSPALAQTVERTAPIAGKVVSKRGGETAVFVPTTATRRLEVRQNLKAGDVIRTNAKGALSIVFADRTQIRLAKNSVLRVKAVKRGAPSSLRLEKGKAWGRTPRKGSRLSVETPSATAGIRGTEWSLSAEEERTTLEVYEGEVELFNDAGSLSIAAGQAATARLGEAPTRIALVNRNGREQMLYFLRLEDGLDLFAGDSSPGLDAARAGDWEAARDAFSVAQSDSRGRAVAAYGSFLAAIRLGEDPELPPIDPQEPASFAIRAIAESYLGELETALDTVARGLARHPDALELLEAKARIALLKGDGDLAREAVGAVLSRNQDDATALSLKAEIAANYDGKPYEALETAEHAVALAPDDPRVLASASAIQLERGAGRDALRSIDAAIKADPNNAAYHAQRAAVLLDMGQVEQAKPSLDRALELDGSLSILRASLAEYHLLKGQKERALDDALAASAENPAYGRAMLQLVEVNYALGEVDHAIQQLDAADRLDPASPFTPLARTAIALHRFDADGAIEGAGEALNRYRKRGGDYANLSENRATGSLVSQAFRFLGMEAWGRYYADRVFDSFTPSSYFDQALNQTPGPFVVRDADGGFDASNAEDLDQLSSFLQGIALDPLSVANPERELLFDNSAFVEPEIGVSLLEEEIRSRRMVSGQFDAILNGPLPVGIGITASFTDEEELRPRPDIDFFSRSDGGEVIDFDGYVGIEAGAFDHLVFQATFQESEARASTNEFSQLDPDVPRDAKELREESNRFVFGLWNHEFGYRSRSTVAFGTGTLGRTTQLFDEFDFIDPTGRLFRDQRITEQVDFVFASASYAHSIDFIDLKVGAEYADFKTVFGRTFFDASDPITGDADQDIELELLFDELRFFADARARIGERVLVQGHTAYVSTFSGSTTITGPQLNDFSNDVFTWRLAAAYEPVAGQWLRIGRERSAEGLFAFSFAPVNTLGLKGNKAPRPTFSTTDSWIMRWDAQWSDRFFTSIEYQDQTHEFLDYELPDVAIDLGGGPIDVNRLNIEANYWPGSNFGLRASYSYTDSAIVGTFQTVAGGEDAFGGGFGCGTFDTPFFNTCQYTVGQQVPFVPQHIGQASVVWVLPDPVRLRTRLSANYIGGQIDDINFVIPDYTTVDLKLEWEPWDRRIKLGLSALNLLDEQYVSAAGINGPRRTIIASAGFRF